MIQKRLNFMVFAALVCTTLGFGLWGWIDVLAAKPDLPVLEPLYRTLLAFTGDGIYVTQAGDLDWRLRVARITGLGATISALFGLALAFLAALAKRARARLARGRTVVIGASDFAIDYAARCGKFMIFDDGAVLDAIDQQLQAKGGLWLPGRLDENAATGSILGFAPRRVIFGSPDAITNVERARVWLRKMRGIDREKTELILRIEDNSVARDLVLLTDEFRDAKLISRSETVARALVTAMAPTHLAQLRGHPGAHVVLVGLGKVNLAVAEELLLRCHHPGQAPLRLTILDNHMSEAQARLRSERPDLLNPEFAMHGPFVEFFEMDALECCAAGQADRLIEEETKHPITAIVVAAGRDTRNVAIAMRLRQLQMERLCLKAPIYMRSDSQSSIAPEPARDLTSGIIAFGGRVLDAEDQSLEAIYQSQAKAIHDGWLKSQEKVTDDMLWESLSTQAQRPSYRAALASVEMFYSAGLVPPFGSALSGLRAHGGTVERMLENAPLMEQLWRTEHNRWNAERRAEGYRGHKDRPRDNEKKLHPLIVDCDDLPVEQQEKDRENVRLTLQQGRRRFRASPRSNCWRQVMRVSVMGPLTCTDDMLDRLDRAFRAAFSAEFVPGVADRELEILTPNAPGFDRAAVVRLLDQWQALTGRQGRVLLVNAARRALVDKIAAEHLHGGALPEDNKAARAILDPLAAQEAALRAVAKGRLREIDMRPLGMSDTDLDTNRAAYFDNVRAVQARILALADVMIFETNSGESRWTTEACAAWDGPDARRLCLS